MFNTLDPTPLKDHLLNKIKFDKLREYFWEELEDGEYIFIWCSYLLYDKMILRIVSKDDCNIITPDGYYVVYNKNTRELFKMWICDYTKNTPLTEMDNTINTDYQVLKVEKKSHSNPPKRKDPIPFPKCQVESFENAFGIFMEFRTVNEDIDDKAGEKVFVELVYEPYYYPANIKFLMEHLSELIRKYNRFFKTIELTNKDFLKTLLSLLTLDDTKLLLLYIDDINNKYQMKFIKCNDDDDDEQLFLTEFQKLRESIIINNVNLKEKCLFLAKYFQLLHHFINVKKMVQYIYNRNKVHRHLDECLEYFSNNKHYDKVFLKHFLIECTDNLDNNNNNNNNNYVTQILKRYYRFMENRNIIKECDLRNIIKLLLENNLNLLFKSIDNFHLKCQNKKVGLWKNKEQFLYKYGVLKENALENGSVIATFINYIKLLFDNVSLKTLCVQHIYHSTLIDYNIIKNLKTFIIALEILDSLQVKNFINHIILWQEEEEDEEDEDEEEEIYDILVK